MAVVKPTGRATWRQLLAELMGAALLVTVVVGSGIAAARLSPSDAGLQLLENSTATVLGLAVLILVFGPVSGGHFNPLVAVVDWLLTRRSGDGLSACGAAMYAAAQVVGAVFGALLANVMFDHSALQVSGTDRVSRGHGIGELVATAGLGRVFSDMFAGIAPTSALFFIAAQILGGLTGFGLVRLFFPDALASAGRAVVPHPDRISKEG